MSSSLVLKNKILRLSSLHFCSWWPQLYEALFPICGWHVARISGASSSRVESIVDRAKHNTDSSSISCSNDSSPVHEEVVFDTPESATVAHLPKYARLEPLQSNLSQPGLKFAKSALHSRGSFTLSDFARLQDLVYKSKSRCQWGWVDVEVRTNEQPEPGGAQFWHTVTDRFIWESGRISTQWAATKASCAQLAVFTSDSESTW